MVNVVDMPIKCPVAPLEFCFLADWYLRERGVRDAVELTYATPLDGAFTKPVASRALEGLLAEKGVQLVTEFNAGEVAYGPDGRGGRITGYDGREVPFDLAVVIPLHDGADYVARSPGLGDDLGFVPADPATLQSHARENVFAIGDASDLPVSKAGSVTHFEGEVLTENVVRLPRWPALDAGYDGHANCFIETGFSKALMIDFNYDTEPLPGHFPGPIGMPLLKESRLNHLGKLMFQWFYWHTLLPGRDIPGVGADMPMRGKHRPDAAGARGDTGRGGDDRMSTATYAGVTVDVNDEGFFERPEQWTREIAVEIARADGIAELTDRHWQVIDFMRREYAEKGTGPTVRVLGKASGRQREGALRAVPQGARPRWPPTSPGSPSRRGASDDEHAAGHPSRRRRPPRRSPSPRSRSSSPRAPSRGSTRR